MLTRINRIILGLTIVFFFIGCSRDLGTETYETDIPASLTPDSTSTITPSSPTPELTRSPSASPSLTPTLENLGMLITPMVLPGPTISGTYYPEHYCYDVPLPELNSLEPENSGVFVSASLYLCEPFYNALDLDKVVIGNYFLLNPEENLEGADIYLSWATAAPYAWLTELADVEFRHIGIEKAPTIDQCKAALTEFPYGGLTMDAGDNPEILEEFGCVRTTEDRYGYVQIQEVNPLLQLSVKISFVIWNQIIP